MSTLPTLDAIVPVLDERAQVEGSLRALRTALDRSPWQQARVIVVDDGSRDGTGELLDELAPSLRLHVVHQANSGRLAARERGMQESTADLALLIDSRVTVHASALGYLADELRLDPSARIWNGDVTVDTAGNPYAAFWSALTVLGWRRYFAHPRRMSYGPDEFDRYPKGTTMFVAPREWLLEESRGLQSHFVERRFSSDDTAMIRGLVRRGRINLSPGFSCTYRSRDSLGAFLRHARVRGTMFVDSYVGRPGPLGKIAVAGAVAGPVFAVTLVRRPRLAAGLATTGAVALGAAARASGAPGRDAAALSALSPVFGVAFGSGFARGLRLALSGTRRPRT